MAAGGVVEGAGAEEVEPGGEGEPPRFPVQALRERAELGLCVLEEAVSKAEGAWGSPVEGFLIQLALEPLVLL